MRQLSVLSLLCCLCSWPLRAHGLMACAHWPLPLPVAVLANASANASANICKYHLQELHSLSRSYSSSL
ncbi:hypothetical protein GcM3_c146o71 [Golovinomyces cichoracearum]|uniref:Secreted effector protein n=1 Tax=Golovinomyces cichoracearum TaxID=62708 RepID=A0A420J3G3_9PEZI|nr:hypothetical protein GcM3_c146o71 [Golovinomyces cichoracearum]